MKKKTQKQIKKWKISNNPNDEIQLRNNLQKLKHDILLLPKSNFKRDCSYQGETIITKKINVIK